MTTFPLVQNTISQLQNDFNKIPVERKRDLLLLSAYISLKLKEGKIPEVIVICTHNSRRSHMGQVWLAVAAEHFGFALESYSGGTEATAFNGNAVAALEALGFSIFTENKAAKNPRYQIKWKEEMTTRPAFSKKYMDAPNPTTDFGSIMVCNSADEACPIVSGCDFRLALPYKDPKAFDGTPLEAEKYLERALQIGREMFFVGKNVEK